ncbi:MAG TPA: cell envelope biogenesis protein OmpA, partial [Parvularcula sp.]|nr:cell envelope biogenesis protein OmpA [Parvularcula sp.]
GFSGWPALDGDLQAYSVMFNVIRDFDTGGNLTPYVGLGLGGASFKNQVTGPNAGFGALVIDDSNKRLAYQAIAGVAVKLAEGLALDLSYRYFAAAGTPKFDGTIGGSPVSIRHDYDTHSLFAGLRWNFGAAAAPAATQYKDCWDGSSVPVASECPPQLTEQQAANLDPVNVIVYFDYDKANLTPEASNLIKEAAARALANDVDAVVVSGHADRSGGSAYNQALSERRGSVVRDALIANGIAADKIRMEAYGEDKPAKPTEDGVREPLNRRTEVTISFQ